MLAMAEIREKVMDAEAETKHKRAVSTTKERLGSKSQFKRRKNSQMKNLMRQKVLWRIISVQNASKNLIAPKLRFSSSHPGP
jgi:hypothetical protein